MAKRAAKKNALQKEKRIFNGIVKKSFSGGHRL
jgi:hypothetical protein